MSDNKIAICAEQDKKFIELIDHVITRTGTSITSNEAIAILVSLGEMCPKLSLAIKMISPPMTMMTKRQSDIFEFFAFTLDYATSAQTGRKAPLELMRDLNEKAISARDKFTSSLAS